MFYLHYSTESSQTYLRSCQYHFCHTGEQARAYRRLVTCRRIQKPDLSTGDLSEMFRSLPLTAELSGQAILNFFNGVLQLTLGVFSSRPQFSESCPLLIRDCVHITFLGQSFQWSKVGKVLTKTHRITFINSPILINILWCWYRGAWKEIWQVLCKLVFLISKWSGWIL